MDHLDNQPVIIGTGQLVDREGTVENHIEPLEMLIQVAQEAARDSGVGDEVLQALDVIALVETAGWHPDNGPDLLAQHVGASPSKHYVTGTGGQVGVTLLNFVADQISRGECGATLVAGCNNLRVLRRAIAQGKQLNWTRGGKGAPQLLGGNEPGNTELEQEYGLKQPPDIYPLFENALRADKGWSLQEHRTHMGKLFTGFTREASNNPYAWFPIERSAEELTTVTASNRMISWPYPKYLNAILDTEQAAGLIICSAAQARSLGVPEDKWVYWWGGASSQEEAWWASERPSFAECPAMKDAHLSALANAGLALDEIDLFDFYSCFPVAVEMACKMLDLSLDDPRGFTVTGGLPYAGGPASAYTLHSLATMASRLRENPGQKGLVTGNGWYLTKHSAAVLASQPRPSGLPIDGLVDDLPSAKMDTQARQVDITSEGQGVIDAYTVTFDRDGNPSRGIVVGSLLDGTRFLANTVEDPSFLNRFLESERVGCSGLLRQVNGRALFEPIME